MWAGKWVWAAIATSWTSVADSVVTQIRFRINAATGAMPEDVMPDAATQLGFAEGFQAALGYWLMQPLTLVVVLLAVAVLLWRAEWHLVVPVADNLSPLIAIPILAAVGWMLIANNWLFIHFWFEYRSLPMILGAVLLATSGNKLPESE